MSRTNFVNLHTHSHYSLLEAIPKIPELVAAAKSDGQNMLALTDNGNMYGAIEFYKECKDAGIKPIIGVDFFVAPRTRRDKEHRIDDHTSRLVLLAKNETGYRNLMQLVSKSHLEGFYYRPRIDLELMAAHRDGLIAILPSLAGPHIQPIRDSSVDRAREIVGSFKHIFPDDIFFEITHHPEVDGHESAMKMLVSLSAEMDIPLVAAQDTYYLKKDDALARELVDNIRTARVLNRDFEQAAQDLSFMTQDRAHELFVDIPHALENSAAIAESCTVELALGTWVFPAFPIREGSSAHEELRSLAEKGFETRAVPATEENKQRVDYELSIIGKKGYSPYFLVVADLLRHAREERILTNTRGSAAGSLVSYLCGITTVNPLEYQLPFERFLNPERPSPPDIDMDLADNQRDKLIAYVREKYGSDKVAQIGTFGTMMARAAVRDASRALGHPYGLGDTIAKLIPFGKQGFPVTIAGALEETPELAEIYKKDPDAREVLDLAQKIEGNARHVGVHAAGVVIAPTPVTDFSPIQIDPKGNHIITQYDMYAIEEAGLLKFDFLGLTNLSVLADSVARVEARHGISVDLDTLPLDDTKTFEMLSRGETLGVFQLAGGGMTSYLVDLKPTSIHDINAMVALYRPGPMNFIPAYIERKKNPSLVKYLDPRMEEILKKSYGVITYQDDVLEIAIKIASYSWLEADKFRKAMGKKIPAEMKAQKEKFTKGCVAGGMKKVAVQMLWEQIETFAAYGFNKAHAASYGNLAYKTAYMKANFPVDYMAAVLTADAGDVERIAEVVGECTRMGIKILPPSVQSSEGNFTVIDDTSIRFGLYSIKNFGTGVGDSIIAAREKCGPFADIADFLVRVSDPQSRQGAGNNLNKKSLESLIQAGALDEFGERGNLMAHVEMLLEYHREHLKTSGNQTSLFGGAIARAPLRLPASPPTSLDQRLVWEKELLGLYVSGHPLDKHKSKFSDRKKTIAYAKENLLGAETVIAGYVESVRVNITKKGERMAFLKLTDFSGSIELVAFPRTYKENEALLVPAACIAVKGRISERNGESSFVVERVKVL